MEKQKHGALSWVYEASQGLRLRLIGLILTTAIYASSSVLFALACKEVIDRAGASDIRGVFVAAGALFGVIFAQLVLRWVNRNLEEYIRARLEVKLKSRVFSALLHKQYRGVTGYHTGELQTRLVSDVTVVCDGVCGILPGISGMAARLISAFSALVVMEPRFVALFLIGGVLLFGITRAFRSVMKRLHKRVQSADGRVRGFLQESLESLLVIKVFGAEEQVAERAKDLQEAHFREKRTRWRLNSVANTGFGFLFQMAYLCALVWCSLRMLAGTLSFGSLTAVLQLVGQIQTPLANLSGVLPKYYGMIASAERLQELEELEDENTEHRIRDARGFYRALRAIKLENVTFAYDRDPVLCDASFVIRPGDFVAIMGRSGIGKSTLLKLLLDVFPPQSGTLAFETEQGDVPVSGDTRPLFSYVPQGNLLFSGTVRENLTFAAPNAGEEEITRALHTACAEEFIRELPDGLDTVIGEHGQGLSEGQAQRIAIARALLRDAPILLLDEATSALDEATEEAVLTRLLERKDLTCVIVSHKTAALRVCNRRIEVRDGRICEVTGEA